MYIVYDDATHAIMLTGQFCGDGALLTEDNNSSKRHWLWKSTIVCLLHFCIVCFLLFLFWVAVRQNVPSIERFTQVIMVAQQFGYFDIGIQSCYTKGGWSIFVEGVSLLYMPSVSPSTFICMESLLWSALRLNSPELSKLISMDFWHLAAMPTRHTVFFIRFG